MVLGCGAVGLSVIQGARDACAAMIIAVDLVPARLQFARQLGATHTIQSSRADVGLREAAAQVKELTSGRGADFAFECVAVPELGPSPLRFVRNGGMALGISGIEQVVPFDMELFEWDKTYIK